MSSCLYECLCEARLEQYYTHFTAMGFLKSQELVKLTMNDYSSLGICNMHDQERLYQLIQIIKAVQKEKHDRGENTEHTQRGSFNSVEKIKPGPRRHLDFDSLSGINAIPYSNGYPNLPSCSNHHQNTASGLLKSASLVDQLSIRVCPKNTESVPGREADNPTIFLPNSARDCSHDEVQNAQMIFHISGYNYGLPHAALRHTNPVKEQIWTGIEKIHVCVRKRPLRVREVRRGEVDIAKVEGGKSILLCEKKEAVDLTHYLQQHVFYFDEVFEEACTNHDVYLKTAYPLIQHVFGGGKATCFAYGQTGAGKTHTTIGTYRNPGLYALAAEDIFIHLQTSEPDRALFIWISFYEIYCGQLYDLLNGRKRLFAREDGNHAVQIVGLHEIRVEGVKSLLEVISWGSKARSTGASGINTDSSRSHAIIQIQLKDSAEAVVGRISFIDLAGSERAADAGDSDKQAKLEGAEINQSLLALKECIRALDQDHAHTPFRQSKLTLVLKDSFIGNSKTCMIANISPSHMATEHTLNTLRYADRVKEIKRGVKASSIIFYRCQGGRSPSPKQTKTRGNKSVPKNVKSRIEQSQYSDKNATHLKLSSAALHPPHVLLCSTPKIAGKNVLSPATSKIMWQSHSTPLKGMFKKNSSDISKNTKNEGPDEAIVRKEAFPNNPKSGTSRKMQCEQRNYLGITRNVKVQAVQPIQKEVIPRNELHFTGQIKNHSPNKENNAKHFESEYQKSPENKLFLQKERENHLRLYHQQLQQLQQPPLLQKKLSYHPLKELLSQFYQPKIEVSNEENVSTIQRSDVQIECSLGCDSHSDCQNTNNRDSVCEKEREKGESGRNNIQVLPCFQDQGCNPRIEDTSVCSSPWSIEEECAVHCSSGDNAAEIYSQNNIDYGQMKPRHLSPDSKNSLQNVNQDNFSTDHQDANFPVTKVSQMDSSFHIAADLNSVKTGATTSLQSSRNIDFHLNWAIKVAKDEQACNTNNIIPSIDCISKELMNVSDDQLSVDRPLSQDVHSGDEGMMISCNQCFADMEVFPTDSDVLSPQANHVEKWMTLSHDHLDKNHSFSSDLSLNTKNASDDQHLILIDETKMQITAKDENDHCSNINHTEACYKDVNILPDMSTNNCAGFLTPLKHDLRQEESLGALSCGSLSNSDISQVNEYDKHAIKCFKSRLHDTNTEETVINSLILHLNPGVASTTEAEAEANEYFSDAGNQNPQDPHLNQVSRQQGISSVIAYSKLTELINSSELKESQQETEDLVAGSSTEEKLNHPQNEDGCQPSGNSCDKDLVDVIKGKLIQNTSVPFNHFSEEDNSIPIEAFDGCNKKKDGTCGLWSDGHQTKHLIARHQEAMEKAKKLLVQSHCEQLEEMLALFKKEEYLLNKLTLLDFRDYVTQLEEILILKTKSIQRLQGDIHQYQIHPETMLHE